MATMWVQLDRFVTGWADNLFPLPDLSQFAVTEHETLISDGVSTSRLTVAILDDVTLALPGVDVLTLELLPGTYGPELTAEFDWTGPFAVRLLDLGANLVIASPLLVPVQGEPGAWVPQLNTDGSPAPVRASVQAGVVQIDGAGGITATLDNAISLGSFMIGDTGIVLEVSNARPSFAGTEPPPDTAVRGFRGLLFDSVTLHFPDGIELGGILPETIQVLDGAIGTGGFSGAFTGEWDVTWQGTTPSGDGAGTLLGFPFGLRSLQLQVQQDCVTTAVLAGSLAVPFFDQVLTVAVAIDSSGGFAVTVTGTPESPPALGYDTGTTLATPAVATLTLPGLGTLRVTSLGVVRDDQGDALVLSGDLSLTVGSPVLSWPTLTVQGLRIGADGSIALDGGWLDLQQPLALNLYGFGMELTRLGFGAEDDGRRWVGVDGALRLTSLLPAGASARGLRVIWDPLHPGALPELTLDGVGVSFGVPGAFGFDGSVALADDPDTGAKLFTGALGFGLDALEIGIDAGITIGRLAPDTYVFVHLGVDLPIPLAATGAALYGLEGLLAISMAPVVASGPWPPGQSPDQPPVVRKGDWYGWYKLVDTKFAASDTEKWSADPGAWALGAGLSIGTLPDAGFSVSTRALLVVLLPGPVLLLQGTADLFRVPPALGGSDQEGTLSLLAALDARAGTLQLGIDAAWRLGQLIDIAAATEAFFDFDRADAWHLWIGQDQPATARIQAGFLALFQADAWLMLGAKGVDTGLGVQWGDSWQFGPATVTLDTWVAGHAALSRRPPQIAGDLSVGGDASVALGPFDLGIDVEAELSGQSPTPYEVTGTVSVSVALPAPLKDLDVDLELSWQQPATPQVDDPWSDAIAGHSRTTESWRPIEGGSLGKGPSADAPVIPLDATVLLTFVKPMGDLTAVADNPPVPAPAETVGRYEATYALTGLRLHRQRRNRPGEGWEDVTATVFGTWTPDAGDAGSRLQLLARSPFDFTRFTSRAWTDDFVRGQPDWPCLPEPAVSPVCTSWNDQPAGRVMPALWAQDGATFASQARLDVVEFEAGPLGTVRLLRLGPAEQDGRAVPGVLWVALPEPASRVSVAVDVLLDRIVLVRAWSGGEPVGLDATLPGPGVAEVSAAAIDAITIDWGFTREIELAAICWTPAAETDRSDAWTFRQQRLETAGQRWSSDEALLEPDSHYLLEVSTRALLTKGGTTVQQLDSTRTLEFQTGGPPGIVPAWDPPPAGTPAGGFPRGGVLADLASYVRWSIPDPAAAPVFRAYDLGCEFSSTAVQQLYGADLVITVQDDNGQPLRDPGGAPVVLANAWEPAPVTTLSVSDAAWLDRLGHCLGADSMAALRGDDVIRAELPSGVLLPPRRALTARLEATRPLFTDPFDSLDAFDPRVLGTGAPVTTCTAGGGAATISRPASGPAAVAALAGDPAEGDYTVECSAECAAVPRRAGTFGLVARYTSPGNYLALELTPGAGRRLAAYTSVAGRQAERVLWADHRAVEVGRTYALTLSCAGPRVTVSVDGEPFIVRAGPGHGRFGLLSAVPAPAGGVFRDLVVRSAPRQVVHQWRFTTSRYAGLPELAATFAGRTWPAAGAAAPDRATFSGAVAAGLAQLEPATAAAGAARDELAAAVAAGNVIDQPALAAAALAAVGGLQAASAGVFRELAQALGLPYAPAPPVLEILAVPDGDEVLALLLDLPEPLPWERMSWSLRQVRSGGHAAGQDVLLAWSEDGRQALLVDPDGSPLAGGPWLLRLTLALDVGAERAAWRRAGSTQAEHADLAFLL